MVSTTVLNTCLRPMLDHAAMEAGDDVLRGKLRNATNPYYIKSLYGKINKTESWKKNEITKLTSLVKFKFDAHPAP